MKDLKMENKNIVLLGGSNSVIVNGLQKGLREGINLHNQSKNRVYSLEFYSFALGGTSSIQKLYEIKRARNIDIISNAELVIMEGNINDIASCYHKEENKPLSIVYRDIFWLYQELYFLNKKVLVLILPIQLGAYKLINNIHRFLCKKFNFNLIDMQTYYKKNGLEEFGNRIDSFHQQAAIMKIFGRRIVDNIERFKLRKSINISNDNPEFKICTPKEMQSLNKESQYINMKNSIFDEITYRLDEYNGLKFPFWTLNYTLIGLHTWSNYAIEGIKLGSNDCAIHCSNIKFQNKNISINKEHAFLNHFVGFNTSFIIDDQSFAIYNKSEDAQFKESHPIVSWKGYKKKINHCDIISFFLASPEGNYHTEEIDFESLANENIEISKEYDFNHLIPPIELYKEIIDEYCSIIDPRKLAPLQKQISILTHEKQDLQKQISILTHEKQDLQNKFQNEVNSLSIKKQYFELENLKQDLIIKKLESKKLAKSLGVKMSMIDSKITFIQSNSAKARIQNHLSYKLGQALIENSKNIFGYIRMPYVLSYIKDKHKLEQKIYEEKIKENPKLALPPLKTYSDYNEALKEKECFTYKLGQEFIKASQNWHKGGYIKFIFKDVPRLKEKLK